MDADDLRRLTKSTGFDLATLEKDYALTWLLSGIYSEDSKLANLLIFKGGTAIRKVYFPEWRLSEDLDFTILRKIVPAKVRGSFDDTFRLLKEKSGIDYAFNVFRSGPYTILADVQFLGPLEFKNRIALDISLKERLVEEPEWKKVKPEYDDVPAFRVQVYSLNEILLEKIRSIMQRGKARDYYDVWRFMKEHSFNEAKIKKLLIEKCKISNVDYRPNLLFDEDRLSEAGKFWGIALARLTKDLPEFQNVVAELRKLLAFVQ